MGKRLNYTRKFLIEELKRFNQIFNRQPKIKDFNKNLSFPSVSIYQKIFGSWNNALIEAGFTPYREKLSEEKILNIINDYNSGMSSDDIAIKYGYSDGAAIYSILNKKNIKRKTKKWTKQMIKILKEKYPYEEWDTLVQLLYPFTKDEIAHKAYKLNVKRDNYYWTEEQINFLKENINLLSYKKLSKKLNKTPESISTKAYKLGLLTSQKWTNDEIELLKELYPHKSNVQIAKVIGRGQHCVCDKAKELGLRKNGFIYYDLDEFIDNLIKYADKLGRTPLITEVCSQEWSPSIMSINRYFGGYRKVCKLIGLEINFSLFGESNIYYSKNNDACFSKSEMIITNFFIDNNIKYKKEVLYINIIKDENCGTKRCDWLLKDGTIVEYFGMPKRKDYQRKMDEKRKLCKDNGINLLEIFEKDITKLNDIFRNYLIA